jgi:hypothetical protein
MPSSSPSSNFIFNIIFINIFFLINQIICRPLEIESVTEGLPEYIKSTTTKHFYLIKDLQSQTEIVNLPLEGIAITLSERTDDNVKLENLGPILCTFYDEEIKTSPSLLVYCLVIACSGLFFFLQCVLDTYYVRQIIDRIQGIIAPTSTNGLVNNREDPLVNTGGPTHSSDFASPVIKYRIT